MNTFVNSLKDEFTKKPDLKQYDETMYISKSEPLKYVFQQLINNEVVKDDELYDLIKGNKWRNLDNYIKRNPGSVLFFVILQQLFLFKYFLPESEKISRKQFEIAMGIQQVRWMVDPENCRKMNNHTIDTADFLLWDSIETREKEMILPVLFERRIKYRLRNPGYTVANLDTFLSGTVWYRIKRTPNDSGGWPGYGENRMIYPIPETLNFSEITCIYTPKLLFGSLSDQTLFKYIIHHNQRPYAAHLPDALTNLCIIHDIKEDIVSNWIHDFQHSSEGGCRYADYSHLNYMCNLSTPINKNTVKDALADKESELTKCLYGPGGDKIARGFNDSGIIWSDSVPVFQGGKRNIRKTKKNKNRKQIKKMKKRMTRKSK